MKKFKEDGSEAERGDVYCYAFSKELLGSSEKDMTDFLKVLCFYFPYTECKNDRCQPIYENPHLLSVFELAYKTVTMEIEARRTRKRHQQIFLTSVVTVVVLVVTLVNTIIQQCKLI